MIFVGLDPGLKGGLAALTADGKILMMEIMPLNEDGIDPVMVRNWLTLVNGCSNGRGLTVALEKAQAMPGQGGCSMFNYGQGYGCLRAVLALMSLQVTLVRPQTWTKIVHVGTDGGEAKDRSRQAALRLWPGQGWTATDRCRKPHDGMIDACLISEWCRRTVSSTFGKVGENRNQGG